MLDIKLQLLSFKQVDYLAVDMYYSTEHSLYGSISNLKYKYNLHFIIKAIDVYEFITPLKEF